MLKSLLPKTLHDIMVGMNITKLFSQNKRVVIIIAIVIAIIGIILCTLHYTKKSSITNNEKYYFTDSRYQSVRSKFLIRESKNEKTSLEYPITDKEEINQTIAKAIDKEDEEFRQILGLGTEIDEPMTEIASYQITHNDENYLSIQVVVNQDTHGAHPASISYFWTFDKTNGQVLKVTDLVANSKDAIQTLLSLIKKKIKDEIATEKEFDLDLNEFITEESISNFTVGDRNTIAWPFGQGKILPSSYGDLTVKISVDDIKMFLQNDIAKILFDVPELSKASQLRSITSGNPSSGNHNLAITFDDGPGNYTEKLLDMLKERGVKATFYILGSKVKRYSDIVRRIDAEGHQIGNHSWNHPDLAKLTTADIQREIGNTNDAIYEIIHKRPTTIRPPYGSVNDTVLDEIRKAGMTSILWSVDTRDWADRNSKIVCNRAVAGAHPGAIILLHDIHPTSVDAVPCIIDTLQKQGYKFVTVDTLLNK